MLFRQFGQYFKGQNACLGESQSAGCGDYCIIMAGLDEDKEDADIVLVGPQVRCALASVRERVPERIPVMAVDTRDYGMAKGDRVMQAALDEIRQYKEHKIHME